MMLAKFDRLAARIGSVELGRKSELAQAILERDVRVHQFPTRFLVTPSPWGPGPDGCPRHDR